MNRRISRCLLWVCLSWLLKMGAGAMTPSSMWMTYHIVQAWDNKGSCSQKEWWEIIKLKSVTFLLVLELARALVKKSNWRDTGERLTSLYFDSCEHYILETFHRKGFVLKMQPSRFWNEIFTICRYNIKSKTNNEIDCLLPDSICILTWKQHGSLFHVIQREEHEFWKLPVPSTWILTSVMLPLPAVILHELWYVGKIM